MFKQKFAENLKKIRKSRKLTQEQLAEIVGVDFRYISFIENARSFPSCELIEKLSNALNVDYADLFSYKTLHGSNRSGLDFYCSLGLGNRRITAAFDRRNR